MHRDNLIFIHKLIKAIADAIIIVFIPLYILKETEDIRLSMAYLIMYSTFVMLFMFILKKAIQKYGVICMIIHFIPIVITEGILSFLSVNIYTILVASILMGLAQALYSVPLNLVFTFGDKKSNVGKFMIASNIGKLVFILISGTILANIENSFWILALISSIFYILCAIPIMFAYKELKENYNKYDNKSHVKLNKWFIIFHISFGLFQPIMDNVIPLYVYLKGLSFQSVTILIVLVEFLKIIINAISQKLVKKNKALICVIVGFFLFMISGILMVFINNSIALYIISCTCSISFPLTFVPMFGLYCNYLRGENNIFSGMTRRDFEIFSARPIMYATSYLGLALYPCIAVGLLAVPVMLLCEIKLLNNKVRD